MKAKLIYFIATLSTLIFAACTSEDQPAKSTFIGGKYIGAEDSLTIYIRDYSKEIDYTLPVHLDTVVTTKEGLFSINLNIDEPKELALESNFDFNILFVEPGDSIYFETDGNYQTPLKNIGGKGSGKLELMSKLKMQLSFLEFIKLDSAEIMDEFENRLKVYKKAVDSLKVPFQDYMKASQIQETFYFHFVFPRYVKAYSKGEFPTDTIALYKAENELVSFSSKGMSNFGFSRELFSYLMGRLPESDSSTVRQRLDAYEQLVYELQLPKEKEQQMLGKGYLSFLEQGHVDEVEPSLQNFLKHYPESIYQTTLDAEFEAWKSLSKGYPAPDFNATFVEGKNFKLSDLEGKVVYIDIWATWCGPCLQEFPFTKEIKDHFKGNDDVVFLYVAIGASEEKWESYLAENKGLKGVHVYDPGNFESKVAKTYKVSGIPRYMIIDKDGNIFSTEAKRPSSGEALIEQLNEALGF